MTRPSPGRCESSSGRHMLSIEKTAPTVDGLETCPPHCWDGFLEVRTGPVGGASALGVAAKPMILRIGWRWLEQLSPIHA